ncbi:2'-5' RNA ligase family protein [Phyllobacterium salinisoli]|nr:2'-5' RNA ligase family protein [Phyllobacterium salinisoli]
MQESFEFLEDLPPRPRRPERLFFCLFPHFEAAFLARHFAEQFVWKHHLAGNLLQQQRLHVSLHHIGDFRRLREKFIYAAGLAARAVSMRPFEVTCRSIMSFESAPSRKRPLVLLGESDPLLELHKCLGAAMKKNGLRTAEHFVPHMTLSYGSKPVALQATEPIRFVVDEFALVHSKLWLTEYDVLGRWPLGG